MSDFLIIWTAPLYTPWSLSLSNYLIIRILGNLGFILCPLLFAHSELVPCGFCNQTPMGTLSGLTRGVIPQRGLYLLLLGVPHMPAQVINHLKAILP